LDEATAFFGKRTYVLDAYDRYANPEANCLLQRIEDYRGTVVLTTNHRENMNFAFTHLMDVVFRFSLPDSEERHKLS
jgi:SpoVK/Ycf46/Vps4 family AAA+-type ATPase